VRGAQREEDLVREPLDVDGHPGEPRRMIDLRQLEERAAHLARIAALQAERLERVTPETLLHVEQELACTELIGTHQV
jgi:hypothetical protein